MTSTSCDCLFLYNVSFIVFLNCKLLWIKASAKLINVKQFQVRGECSLKHRHSLSGHEVKGFLTPAKQINPFLCAVMKVFDLNGAYKSC